MVKLMVLLVGIGTGGLLAPVRSSAQLPELVFLQEAEALSLDHLRDFSVAGLGIHAHIFDPLVDVEGPDFKVVPKLATSWDIVNPTTWRFPLRRGVKFHNGQELTAEDVKFTFERAATPPSIKRSQVATVEKVTVVDPYTVEVTTKQPDAAFLARLGFMYIVSKAAYEKDPEEFGRRPVGTGRYRVVRWDRGQQLVLEAFEQYWGPKPSVARLIVKPVKEATARAAELQTGRAHVIKGVPVEMARTLGQQPGVNVIVSKGVRQVYFRLNGFRPPFSNVRVRQAVNYAVDREAIVKHILEGFGEVRTGPFSQKQWGYDPNVQEYTYDPDKARRLLREAGYASGVDVTFDIGSHVVKGVEIAEAIANQLRQVGIRVRLNVLEQGKIFENVRTGNFDISVTTWSRQADPDSIVAGLGLHSSNKRGFKDERVDALIEENLRTLDPAKRLQVLHRLHRAIVEAAPWLMVHAQDEVFGVREGVPWTPYPFGGNAGMVYFIPMP